MGGGGRDGVGEGVGELLNGKVSNATKTDDILGDSCRYFENIGYLVSILTHLSIQPSRHQVKVF